MDLFDRNRSADWLVVRISVRTLEIEVMPERQDDKIYPVNLTGREIWWLIYLANEELKRMQDLSVEDGNSMLGAKRFKRWEPISDAFIKLNQVGEINDGLPIQQSNNVPPTSAGLYWWRRSSRHDWEMLEVTGKVGVGWGLCVSKNTQDTSIDDLGGEWGPKITSPPK